jgi:hypothetical protein
MHCNHFAKLMQMAFELGFPGKRPRECAGDPKELLREQVIIARYRAIKRK